MKIIWPRLFAIKKFFNRLRMSPQTPFFGSHGTDFVFDTNGDYSYSNIYVGNDVNLGVRQILMAALSEIRIGNYVMLGPEVVIIGGNHSITVPGRFMSHVLEKTNNDDLGVEIGDDVWIGARAVILRGVNIGRGSVVGAGALVTKFVPPYAIVAGNPARIVKFRWDVETILNHEQLLYPLKKRLPRTDLEEWQKSMKMLPPRRRVISE